MKRFLAAAAVVFALFGAVALWGMTLPAVQQVERSAVIDADIERVFAAIDDLPAFAAWSPHIPDGADVQFGERAGEGASLAYGTADGHSVGSAEIVQSAPPELVLIALLNRDDTAMLTYALAREDGRTLVVAREERALGGVLARVSARTRRGAAEERVDAGLARLAAAIAADPEG